MGIAVFFDIISKHLSIISLRTFFVGPANVFVNIIQAKIFRESGRVFVELLETLTKVSEKLCEFVFLNKK